MIIYLILHKLCDERKYIDKSQNILLSDSSNYFLEIIINYIWKQLSSPLTYSKKGLDLPGESILY
jgi:hypothetical protein